MYTLPKVLMLLLNVYFNLLLIQPSLEISQYGIAKATFGTLPIETPENISTEAKINQLLTDYKYKLEKLSSIEDDTKAISYMQDARRLFMESAKTIEMELEAKNLSAKEIALLKEKQLLNPIFKQINDASWAYIRKGKLEADVELRNSFLAMDDFMEIIFK